MLDKKQNVKIGKVMMAAIIIIIAILIILYASHFGFSGKIFDSVSMYAIIAVIGAAYLMSMIASLEKVDIPIR